MANLQPSGTFLMDDLYRAGGVLALLSQVKDLFHPEPITVTGRPLVDYLDDRPVYDETVILPRSAPLREDAGIAVLRGNLAPRGAILKPSAATPGLLQHVGPAVVFDSIEDMRARIDDPDLDVTADSVLVLRGCGPRGYPGMPEVGNMPLPRKLLEQGVRDMVRISDARMSGTAYGTVILHVAPEAAAGGPLAFIRTGDLVTVDVENRVLSFAVSDEELQSRSQTPASEAAYASPKRGWTKLYVDHVLQADTGADLDFLVGGGGDRVTRESH
jgi:dihydroxyacid dehydratase/phosphogluconate dehydratase